MTLTADYRPFAAEVSYNSFLAKSLGTHAISVSGRLQGVLTGSEQIGLTISKTPTSRGYLGVSGDFSIGIGSDGARVGVIGAVNHVDPSGESVDALEYAGHALSAQLYGTYPIIRSRAQNLSVGAAFGLNSNMSDVLGTQYSNDRLRPLSVWAAYDFVDPLQAVNLVKATVEHGLNIWDAGGNSRADGSANYTTLQVDAQRNQPLGSVLDGGVSVQLAAHGQVAFGGGGLFSDAECSFGGRQFGRGFDSGVLVGEHCLEGSAELHWARPFDVPDLTDPILLDFYAFADGGILWQKGELGAGEAASTNAASVGLGVNALFSPNVSGLLEVSKPVALSAGDIDYIRIAGKLSVRF